jgi:SAM-dependent methyltransferase
MTGRPREGPRALSTAARIATGALLVSSLLSPVSAAPGASVAPPASPAPGDLSSPAPTPEEAAAMTRIQNACFAAYPGPLIEEMSGKNGPVPAEVRADPRKQIAYLKSEAAVAKGLFYPSLLEDLFPALRSTVRAGTRFLDLGSGDGRVVLLAALLGGRATGIEYDRDLHGIALQALHELQGLIPTERVDLRRGDFFREDLGSYDVLFYFTSGARREDRLLDKIRREMSSSAILLIAYPYGPVAGFARAGSYGAVQTFRRRAAR